MHTAKIPFLRITAVILFCLYPAGCSFKNTPIVRTELVMGTIAEVTLWDRDGDAAEDVFREFRRIDDKFSRYKKNSEILNTDKEISDELRYLIKESKRYKEITDGAFDISYRGDKMYDLGGIAKGYAVDRAAEICRMHKLKRAMINLGGNLYLMGYPPGKTCWEVGVKDPEHPEKVIGRIRLYAGTGVATSGNYERPGHIKDPSTGRSVYRLLSVTITAPTAMEADALSTGVFVLGREKGAALIESLPEAEGVIIDRDGVWVSSGIRGRYESLH